MRKLNIKTPPRIVSILVLFGVVVASLQLMSSATQGASQLDAMYSWLVLMNALGSVILLVLIGANIYSLTRQLKKREAGSLLTTRMVSLFVLLALAPAAIVFYFSLQFLHHQGIDSWFIVEMDRAMEDALELSQVSLDQRLNTRLKQTQFMAGTLPEESPANITQTLERLRDAAEAAEMTLFSRQGQIIASSSVNPGDILPHLPDEHVWLSVRQNKYYVALDQVSDNVLMIQVMVAVKAKELEYLQALYPVPVRIADLVDSIEFAFLRYQEMSFLRSPLKTSFTLALTLVLLMSLLAAIWVAFIIIRHIVAPVKELVKGTRAVAAGLYEQQLPVTTHDDLGFLVESFNDMTLRIARARDEAKFASVEVENQRAYLETILANVIAGVISFDASFTIRTVNQAAYRILHVPVARFVGHRLSDLLTDHVELAELLQAIQLLLEQADDIWQKRVAFLGPNGRQELLCRGTPLFSQEGVRVGAVIVFDDVTDLIQAQKNAAWGEVARRLAHEIKNPLTPIQLSAERLQHKLADQLDDKSADVLQRSTRTIVQQVEAMKRMVDDFAEYAKPSKKHLQQLNLANLVQEVLQLYLLQAQVTFNTVIATDLPEVKVDPVSIRQVLHNLIKNALEAEATEIDCVLKQVHRNETILVELAFYDNGLGLQEGQVDNIFEPYITTKTKGTGLGLAIVKKIIEEHGGAIWVDNTRTIGAGFIIQLPAVLSLKTDADLLRVRY
ncbi:MAG: PAS domain-containing protein [Methylococcaceae bacterium]|nr:PAS domain-containing protein [Methylococcaceae bacterium]